MHQRPVQITFYNGVILSALSPPSGEMHMLPFYWNWQGTPLTLYHTPDLTFLNKPPVGNSE